MIKPKILFVTDHYVDKKVGGAKASLGFIKVFSEVFDEITFIYPEYEGSDIAELIPSNVKGIPCIDNRSKFKKGLDLYRGRLHRYGDFLRVHLASNHYDLIVIDHSRIWSSLSDTFIKSGSKLITIHHNVEKDYVKDNPGAFYLRVPQTYYAVEAEKKAVVSSDINITLTGNDKDVLQQLYPDAKGHFYHLGAIDFNVDTYKPGSEVDSFTFIITGALSYRQSIVPIVDFVQNYWPVVVKEYPMAKLIIAGREPSKDIIKVCILFPSVELVANPPDMKVWLNKANYYICPINLGSGQKTRISDGLKSGMSVLCHEVSVYGYECIRDAGFIYPYNDMRTFKSALKQMITTQTDGQFVFNSYKNFFGLEAGVQRLSDILEKENVI